MLKEPQHNLTALLVQKALYTRRKTYHIRIIVPA